MKFNIELDCNIDIDLAELWDSCLRDIIVLDDCDVMAIGVVQTLADVTPSNN